MSSHSSLNHIYRTVWNQALGAMVAVAEIASGRGSSGGAGGSGVAGPSRLAALPLCIAVAWGAASGSALANPSGGAAVAGQASMVSTGNNLLVNTQNAAGANHSAINWQSFSIPAGNTTYFQQPSVSSTVINRVVTNTPSQIFGTLGSNGHLVLVNQAGIAVGAGAVVDTAGFTASALRMGDADALAGRLRFGDGTASAAGVSVQGSILARSGDVVLVGGSVDVGKDALIQSPSGATILVAGHAVSIRARGLEGIQLDIQAPSDSAVNLGTLKGDAVGIFAGTLKHSGVIQATTATMEGGKVVLKAAGDAYVQGAGKILASGAVGGSVDVLGNRVALTDQAQIDVSGDLGGGTVRVGGDYQGKNAEVPNAQISYFGPQASIKADATVNGDGGKVIVWADDTTRAYGSISAKGGKQGGDGGFVETSGKHSLDVAGVRVETRAPAGKTGLWLLDPNNIDIGSGATVSAGTAPNFSALAPTSLLLVGDLLFALNSNNVSVTASGNLTVSAPVSDSANLTKNNLSLTASSGTLTVNSSITLTNKDLKLESTAGGINLNADLSLGGGTLELKSDLAITQGSTNVITASKLGVESTGSSGGIVSLGGPNMVGTAAAQLSSGAFNMVNAQSLEVGTVGSVSGVTVTNSNAAAIDISTTTGNLTINQPVLAGPSFGGRIALAAANGLSINKAVTSQTSTVPAGSVILAGGTGISSHFADGIITTVGLKATSGCCVNLNAPNVVTTLAGTSTGSFTFKNAGAFSFGVVESTTGVTTNGGDLTVTSGGAVTTGAITTNGGSVSVTTSAGDVTTGVVITNGGNLSVTSAGAVAAGDIVTKGGSVTLTGTGAALVGIDTSPPVIAGGNGGSVTITASAGDVSMISGITANGVAGTTNLFGSGGTVFVNATGDINSYIIGADADGSPTNTSGLPGNVTIASSLGNITVSSVYTRGTPAQSNQNRNGGNVSITAAAGSVTATGAIGSIGLIGGNITLSGATGVNFRGTLDTSRDYGGITPNGGTVTLRSSLGPVSDETSGVSTGQVISTVLNIRANGVTLKNPINRNNVASLSITPENADPIYYWDADAFSIGTIGSAGAVELKSFGAGDITGAVTATALKILNAGAVTLTVTSPAVTLNEITATSFSLVSNGDISIGGGASGISTSGAGGIAVSTTNGNISVAEGVTATSGNIAFTAGGADKQLTVNSFFSVGASAGNVTYVADKVSLIGTTSSGTAAGKFIEIKPFTSATAIEFDPAADGVGFLRLSSTELATLTTPMLKVGNSSQTGGIAVKEAVAPSTFSTLSLITGGQITQISPISIANLNADAAGGVTLLNVANLLSGNLAGRTASVNGFQFSNAGNLNIDQVDVVNNGITLSGNGPINLIAVGGSITQSGTSLVSTTGALGLSATAGIALKTQVASLNAVTTNGDIKVENTGAITLGTLTPGGSGGRWLIYVADPDSVNKGVNTTSGFRKYGQTYSSYPTPTENGNGYIYASSGVLNVGAALVSGSTTSTFGTAPTAVLGLAFPNRSSFDSEDMAIIDADASTKLATAGAIVFSPSITSATAAGPYSIQYVSGLTAPPSGITFATPNGLAYTVNAAPVSVNTVSLAGTRPYDGTDVVNGSIFSISGLVGSDTLVLSGSGTVADKNVGANKPVTLGTLALGNALNGTGLASNYTLTGGTHVATITKAPITGVTGITAANRAYDGTLVAALTTSGAVIAGMAANDNLSLTSVKGSFDTKNVGDAKAVNITDLIFGGADVDNYSFGAATAAPAKANITQRPLSIWKGPASGGNWSTAANWDALPDASNVAAVALPSGGTVVYDAGMGATNLRSITGSATLAVAGGTLTVADGVSLQAYQQTGGALATPGALTVASSYSQIDGTVVAGGAVSITQTSGDLAVGSITAPSIALKANGSISQTDGLITAGLLSTQSGGGTVLNSAANRVSAFQAASTGAGNIEFTNLGALDVRGLRTASGSIVMRNTGGISTSGPVVARGGKITGVANSPLTIGADGVSADGDISLIATNLTSAGNITLNGPVVSSGGAIAVTAAANLTQNSTVSAALGVTAEAGGTTVFGPAASTVGSPVNYANSGVPTPVPEAPKTVVQEQFIQLTQSRVTVDLVETFSARFEQAVAAQEEAKAPPGSPLRKKKEEENTVVAEAPICPR